MLQSAVALNKNINKQHHIRHCIHHRGRHGNFGSICIDPVVRVSAASAHNGGNIGIIKAVPYQSSIFKNGRDLSELIAFIPKFDLYHISLIAER